MNDVDSGFRLKKNYHAERSEEKTTHKNQTGYAELYIFGNRPRHVGFYEEMTQKKIMLIRPNRRVYRPHF
jgi:hypothetical protein